MFNSFINATKLCWMKARVHGGPFKLSLLKTSKRNSAVALSQHSIFNAEDRRSKVSWGKVN